MTWFSDLTGIPTETPQTVREWLSVEGTRLTSKANVRSFGIGRLTQPALKDLRGAARAGSGRTSVSEVVANVQHLHAAPENAGAVFQVASQFNLLEMTGPSVTPEDGVGRYQYDRTQGPACAIACGAGTIFRNYFAPVAGGIGQTRRRQIDCLADVAAALDNETQRYWDMRNGYALLTPDGVDRLNMTLESLTPGDRDALRGLVRVGVQEDVEVTLNDLGHRVTQVYCSAMPVAYGRGPTEGWEQIARLVLEAAYEATVLVAAENMRKTGNTRLFLTMLGGGAFGNDAGWIGDAVVRALDAVRDTGLDISLVSYGKSSSLARNIVSRWAGETA
ncbi:MAG: hypothetical protein KDK53_16325 [Maritimibacter sp.]|nr:hypothetical protein [Sedimentitalea sp.]MCB1357982.1 hypothetical protein [Maritimibacter sp.]